MTTSMGDHFYRYFHLHAMSNFHEVLYLFASELLMSPVKQVSSQSPCLYLIPWFSPCPHMCDNACALSAQLLHPHIFSVNDVDRSMRCYGSPGPPNCYIGIHEQLCSVLHTQHEVSSGSRCDLCSHYCFCYPDLGEASRSSWDRYFALPGYRQFQHCQVKRCFLCVYQSHRRNKSVLTGIVVRLHIC